MRRKIVLFAFGLLLVLMGVCPEALGQVLDQLYRLNDKEVEKVIKRVEKQANSFRKSLHDALNRSRFDKTRREDDINDYVKDFSKQTSRMHDNFDHHKSTAPDVETMLDRAA